MQSRVRSEKTSHLPLSGVNSWVETGNSALKRRNRLIVSPPISVYTSLCRVISQSLDLRNWFRSDVANSIRITLNSSHKSWREPVLHSNRVKLGTSSDNNLTNCFLTSTFPTRDLSIGQQWLHYDNNYSDRHTCYAFTPSWHSGFLFNGLSYSSDTPSIIITVTIGGKVTKIIEGWQGDRVR